MAGDARLCVSRLGPSSSRDARRRWTRRQRGSPRWSSCAGSACHPRRPSADQVDGIPSTCRQLVAVCAALMNTAWDRYPDNPVTRGGDRVGADGHPAARDQPDAEYPHQGPPPARRWWSLSGMSPRILRCSQGGPYTDHAGVIRRTTRNRCLLAFAPSEEDTSGRRLDFLPFPLVSAGGDRR